MPDESCHHVVGPVEVEHRAGLVWVWCAVCDVVISAWLGDERNDFEMVELRGAAEDVKDHLDRLHRDVDRHDAEALRVCAWKHVSAGASHAALNSNARTLVDDAPGRVDRCVPSSIPTTMSRQGV